MLLGVLCFHLQSCNKTDVDDSTSTVASESYLLSQWMSNDIFALVDEAARLTPGIKTLNCADVVADTTIAPRTITITFDSAGCLGTDGHERRGTIVAEFSGRLADSLTLVTISTMNYQVDRIQVQSGTLTLSNRGIFQGFPLFRGRVMDLVLKHQTLDWTSLFNFKQDRYLVNGSSTPNMVDDDVYEVRGSGSGRGRSGNTYTASIDGPELISASCEYFMGGVTFIEPANLIIRSINHGEGCDATSVVQMNLTQREITVDPDSDSL